MGNCLQRTIQNHPFRQGRIVFPKRKVGRRKIINDHILYGYDSFVISCFVVCTSGSRPSPHHIQYPIIILIINKRLSIQRKNRTEKRSFLIRNGVKSKETFPLCQANCLSVPMPTVM